MPKVTLKQSGPGVAGLRSKLAALGRKEVAVGWGAANSSRPGQPLNNPEVAYLLATGSALNGTPPRPVLKPAISLPANKARITKELAAAADSSIAGDETGMNAHLNRVGMLGVNAVKRFFVDPANQLAPNAPSTIRKKGSSRPGIDTGELRRAVTFLVREKSQKP